MTEQINKNLNGLIFIPKKLLEKIDCKKCFKNLIDFFDGEVVDIDRINRLKTEGRGIDAYDLALVEIFAKKNNFKNVVEFGCGCSTIFMKNIGLNVATYSLRSEDGSIKDFNHVNLRSDIHKAFDDSNSCDFLFIDSEHSYNMAECYFNNILKKTRKPFIVHDFIYPFKLNGFFLNGMVWGEAYYLIENVIDNGYELFTFFCLPNYFFEENKIPKCFNNFLDYRKGRVASGAPIACCAIFLPI